MIIIVSTNIQHLEVVAKIDVKTCLPVIILISTETVSYTHPTLPTNREV